MVTANEHRPGRFAMFGCVAIAALTFAPSLAQATGWNDFQLRIDSEFEISRCDPVNISLCSRSAGLLIPGPVLEYSVGPDQILVHAFGRTVSGGIEYADQSNHQYFVVMKRDKKAVGPLSESEFAAHPAVVSVSPVTWTPVKNPHPERARAGQIMFLIMSVFILGWPILLLMLVVGLVLIVRAIMRRRRRSPA